MNNSIIFQTGGWLGDGALYIERKADKKIIESIQSGDKLICLLEPSQSGKTSLCYRTIERLRNADEVLTVFLDLGGIGPSSASEIQFYFSVASLTNERLGLPNDEIYALADEYKATPKVFWREFIKSLSRLGKKIVIFIDEIGLINSANFDFDDFFSTIAESGNVSAVLSGIFSLHLIEKKSPEFAVLEKTVIPLKDFTEAEMNGFVEAFNQFSYIDGEKTVGMIYEWTSGHPCLSQKTAERFVSSFSLDGTPGMDEAVESQFFNNNIISDISVIMVDGFFNSFIADVQRRKIALEIYESVLKTQQPLVREDLPTVSLIGPQKFDEILDDMSICGLIAINGESKKISCRNKIYRKIYDERWIESKRRAVELNE